MARPGYLVTRATSALILLAAVAGAVSSTAGASDQPPDSVVRAASAPDQTPPLLIWRMADRFGAARQTFYAADGRVRATVPVVTPSREEIHAPERTVELDACAAAPGPEAGYAWRFDGGPPVSAGCRTVHTFAALGPHRVEVSATAAGRTMSFAQTIELTDYLIVSLGDSYASGEGVPEVPGRYAVAFPPCVSDGRLRLTTPCLREAAEEAGWTGGACHRSSWAGPAQAALALERDDPHRTVTFVSLACSGAEIEAGVLAPQVSRPPRRLPQLEALASLLCPPAVVCTRPEQRRRVDALIISIGGNDIGFSDIVKACVRLIGSCTRAATDDSPVAQARPKLLALGQQYVRLYRAINDTLEPAHVFLTEYADAWTEGTGPCTIGGFPLGAGIRRDDVRWLHEHLSQPLNATGRGLARILGWGYIDSIAAGFREHGYCAEEPWIVRYHESWVRQGDDRGTLHPNRAGQAFIARRIAEVIGGTLQRGR